MGQHAQPARQVAETGLTNGTPVRIRVRAVNSAGAGPWSFATATPVATTGPVAQWTRSAVTVQETDADRRVALDIVLSEPLTDAVVLSVGQTGGTVTSFGPNRDWEKLSESACVTGATGDARLDAEVGYGLALFGGRFTGTPNVGFGLSDTARDLRIGWRLNSAVRGDPGFEVSLDATRR